MNDIVVVPPLEDAHNWAENFLPGNAHLIINIRKDGRLDEKSLLPHAMTTCHYFGPLLLALLNVP
jgi:hypothetical protein